MNILEKARAEKAKIKGKKTTATSKTKPPSMADYLVEMATRNSQLFHDNRNSPFAIIGKKIVRLKSREYRLWLSQHYYRETGGKAANKDALANAINTLESQAIFAGPEHPVYLRIAEHNGKIYYHLADEAGTVIEMDGDGWRVCQIPPVHFLSEPGQSPAPMPVRGGVLEELRRFINCPDDGAFALLKGWLSSCFRLNGPFPLLVLNGVQGSAKSTTARFVKLLVDPERVRDRCAPRDVRDLSIWASHSYVLSVDNVSAIPDWLSDAFCRLATGGGFGTRMLFENDEEAVFDAKRPVILNGITDFVSRPDLLERSFILQHPPIRESTRMLETEIWAEFQAAWPRLLGALFDRVSAGLRAWPLVDRSNLPRMADAAAFAVACETGMGERPLFLMKFRQNQDEAHEVMLSESTVAQSLLSLISGAGEWFGTATELLADLTPKGRVLPPDWPKQPNFLTATLTRLSASLMKVYGISLKYERSTGLDRTRFIRISKAVDPDALDGLDGDFSK